MTIGVRTAIGDRLDRLTLDAALPPVPDTEGAPTYTYAPLDPAQAWGHVSQATQGQLERVAGINSVVIATATHIVRLPFHRQATTQMRVQWTDRAGRSHTANVTGVADEAALNETVLVCEEIVP